MVDCPSPSRKHWAILVGIDYYTQGKCLQGSVRDVSRVKEYLETGPDGANTCIIMLTATTPPDPSSRPPSEDPQFWPTERNFRVALENVIESANPGDFVYIHYSGHGSRKKKPDQELGNLALVLYEENECGFSYFIGDKLAHYLRQMVNSGLFVTVVLDCCFSGSVLRAGDVRGTSIRSVEYNSDADVASLSEDEDFPHDISRDTDYTLRGATLRQDQWLVNPDGYAILSACGPHETAQELTLRNGDRRGALSYFLMKTLSFLRDRNVQITHESLYEHMRIMFHASWPQQTPMRYGNRNFSFFNGPVTASGTPLIQVYKKSNSLSLDAGEAHGVHKGDTYALYPPDWEEDAVGQARSVSVTAQVDIVRCLTSDLSSIMPATAAAEIRTGWSARPLTSLSESKIWVRLPASFIGQARQAGASEDRRYLHLYYEEDDTACTFTVVLYDQNRYRILDGLSQAVANLPSIPADIQGADQRLMDSLQHISKFKYTEGIENKMPDATFEASFSLFSSVGDGQPKDARFMFFKVMHGDTWQLQIKNNGDAALYFALFDFEPSWKVHNLLSDSGNGGFWVLEPGKTEHLPLVMEVPEFIQTNGRGCCEDVIKLFVTSKAAPFPSMILPELPLYGSYHRGQPYEAGDGLSALVAGLTGSARGDNARREKWATRSFIITTTKE